MEGIDHVYIVQIGSGCLVSQVYRMLQGEIPDREGFKLGITGRDPAFVFMIELGKAGCHFSASRSRSSDHDQRTRGFNVFIFSITLVTDDQRDIAGITLDIVKGVDFDAKFVQTLLESISCTLTGVLGDGNTSHIQTAVLENIDETKHIRCIGDAKITTDFVFLNVTGTDHDDDLSLIRELHEHAQLAVRCKTGKNTGSMIIVKKLSAELHVKLVPELIDPFTDMFGLHFQIFVVVKSNFHLLFIPILLLRNLEPKNLTPLFLVYTKRRHFSILFFHFLPVF